MNAIAMGSLYLWLKALHVAFMVTWFAGLFYLPRLFIYHRAATDPPGRDRFRVMEKRLFGIMTLGAIVTAVLGVALLGLNPVLLGVGWFQAKLVLLVGLAGYHYRCYRWMQRLARDEPRSDTRWLRWFNEIPALFLLAVVVLAVVKPF